MKKALGIFAMLVAVSLITLFDNPVFANPDNIEVLLSRASLYGIISIGVAFVIITGGIDLSIGSVVALTGCLLAMLMNSGTSAPLAIFLVMLAALAIGLFHGLLITRLKLQPFVVTLCGLLIYRGMARWITNDRVQGFGDGFEGLKYLATGKPFAVPVPFLRWISDGHWGKYKWDVTANALALDPQTGEPIALDVISWIAFPMPMILLAVLAIVAAVFLNRTIYGRYLLALGRNEQAARYSGINTDRMTIIAYVISAMMSGFAGILFALYLNSIQPATHGGYYELYAIAAAVLGGCSLRGGEGSILGVVIGAALMRVIYNSINLMGIPTNLEFAIIGTVILVGVIADELFKRIAAERRARLGAAMAEKDAAEAAASGET
jgi:ribose transport system permease protein